MDKKINFYNSQYVLYISFVPLVNKRIFHKEISVLIVLCASDIAKLVLTCEKSWKYETKPNGTNSRNLSEEISVVDYISLLTSTNNMQKRIQQID